MLSSEYTNSMGCQLTLNLLGRLRWLSSSWPSSAGKEVRLMSWPPSTALVDLSGARSRVNPSRASKFIRFHAVFRKILQKYVLAQPSGSHLPAPSPPRELAPPPGEILDPPLYRIRYCNCYIYSVFARDLNVQYLQNSFQTNFLK